MNLMILKSRPRHAIATAWVLGLLAISTHRSQAALYSYYIGVDGQQTLGSGEFAGLPNPNHNRLTLLFAHHDADQPESNHYHSKGVFRYRPGTAASPAIEVSSSNYLPEGSNPPLSLIAGAGVFAGKSVVAADPENGFSLITFRDTGDLASAAPGGGEQVLFNSSAGRWTPGLGLADVYLVLDFLTPGLNIGTSTSWVSGLANPGDEFHLGNPIDFSPVFWTEETVGAGDYVARFRLVDEQGLLGDSGTFEFRFNAIPEPSAGLLAGGVLWLGLIRRRSA